MNRIDKLVKNKLEHFTVEIPEGTWESIAARLPEQPKKPYRPWMPLFFTCLIWIFTISSIQYSLFENRQNQIPNGGQEFVLTQESNTTVKDSKKSQEKHTNSIITTQVDNIIVSKNDILANAIENLQKTNPIKSTNTSDVIRHFAPNSTQNSEAIVAENIIQNSDSEVEGDKFSDIVELVFLSQPITNSAISDRNLAVMPESISSKNDFTYLHSNKSKSHKLSKNLKSKWTKDKPAKACPFVIDAKDKSLDLYVSHDFGQAVLKANTPNDFVYLNARKATEQSQYSYSVGARFGYNVGYRWNIHTGFNYSQINQKFEYVDPESSQTRVITIKDYIYQNGEVVDSFIKEEVVEVPGSSKMKINNQYKTFDIPILARFTILANDKWSLSSMAGLYINVGYSQKGMILVPNKTTPADFTTNTDYAYEHFKTQIGTSGYANLSLAYHFTETFDILIEPSFKMQFSNSAQKNYPLSQKFNTYGITTGVRYRF